MGVGVQMAKMKNYQELAIGLPRQCASLRDEAHRFAEEVIRPAARNLDRPDIQPPVVNPDSSLLQIIKAAYGLGYHRAVLPAHFGGLGLPSLGIHILLEELGWGSAGIALSLLSSSLPVLALIADGRSKMIERFVKPFVENRDASWIGCWALSEPRHGSDHFLVGSDEFRYPTNGVDLIARADSRKYVLEGQKAAWITNGGIATHALCSVTIEPSKAAQAFMVVPLDLPGVSRSPAPGKLGQREMNQAQIVFNKVEVPREYLLKGEGFEQEVARLLTLAHSGMAAIITGAARAAYEAALDHSTRRRQGGKRICDHQLVRQALFEMFTGVEACRAFSRAALVYNWETVKPSLETAIAAKIFCTRTALQVVDRAMQVFGADGTVVGNPVEKLFRDIRVSIVEQGSNEVLMLAGANAILS